jgi:hypothetical protein
MRIRLFAAASVLAALIAAGPASAVTPAAISIDVNVVLSGDLKASTTRGSFSATGAVVAAGTESGSGRFAGLGHLRTGEPNSLHATMTLAGADGTLQLHLVGLFGHLPAPLADGDGRWVISGGTGAYAELHGRGTWSAEADFRDAMAMTGPPRVAFELTGFVN